MIDCMKTTNYFAERRRMAKQQRDGICKLDCIDCPLSITNNGTNVPCADFDKLYPEKAIAIVQKWSNEHPLKTYLSELLKNYPNAPLGDDGTPMLCPSKLGLKDMDGCIKINRNCDCVKCWNQPIEE